MAAGGFARWDHIANTDDPQKIVINGLKQIYKEAIQPVEDITKFATFQAGDLTDGFFDSPPMVLLLGPYSAGKTSFVRYLVGRNFPGQRIGPEPTTDKFTAVMYGKEDRVVPGNALTVMPGSPFGGTKYFGNGFLTRFEGSMLDCELLKRITLIDTPGVLSGNKQRLGRSYDFEAVLKWFASRADMVILLFDAYKLDISDEMAACIRIIQDQADKVSKDLRVEITRQL